jgi:hypothetical protein
MRSYFIRLAGSYILIKKQFDILLCLVQCYTDNTVSQYRCILKLKKNVLALSPVLCWLDKEEAPTGAKANNMLVRPINYLIVDDR